MKVLKFAAFIALLTVTSAAYAEEQGHCIAEARILAKALQKMVDPKGRVLAVTLDSSTDTEEYTVRVESRPFKWGDGVVRTQQYDYQISLDNDGDRQCILLEGGLGGE